jgi:hypothetical protein
MLQVVVERLMAFLRSNACRRNEMLLLQQQTCLNALLLLLLPLYMFSQVVVERLMAFLRSTACGGDEMLRRHIAGQIVDLAEKYAPDTTWFVGVMAEVNGQSSYHHNLVHDVTAVTCYSRSWRTTKFKMYVIYCCRCCCCCC